METSRLELKDLDPGNAEFIFRLVNTPGWIKYIGERNIKTIEDADGYINKILVNSNITYWVIYLKIQFIPIGIISLVKREYLEHPDIGFPLLPDYGKKGYASEATQLVLDFLTQSNLHSKIQAITVKGNKKSIELLEKLGFKFDSQIEIEKEKLLIYSKPLK